MHSTHEAHQVSLKVDPNKRMLAMLLVATVLPSLCGCVADVNGGLVIIQNQIPESKEGSCLVPAKQDAQRQSSGTYDVGLDQHYPYFFYPLVRNNLPALAEEGQVEPNRIEYEGVEVEIEPPAGVTLPSSASCPLKFRFEERVSLVPDSEAGSRVQVFLPCHSEMLRQMFATNKLPADTSAFVRFRVVVRAVGSHAGSSIRSDPFEYNIRVCQGCLQKGYEGQLAVFDYPAVPACTSLADHSYKGNGCNPGQDRLILCCKRTEGPLDCPGRPQTPPVTSAPAP